MEVEFDRQLDRLVSLDYPKMAGLTEKQFRELASPLKSALDDIKPTAIPFIIVVKQQLVSSEDAMQKVAANNQAGFVKMYPKTPTDFTNIAGLAVPSQNVYLLVDIDTGREFLNISPEDSLKTIFAQKRTPLTLDESVALVAQYPEILTDKKQYNCIQMPGSRVANDQRIPSIWMSDKRPRLGWCWNRNIHTWLGSASASTRRSV